MADDERGSVLLKEQLNATIPMCPKEYAKSPKGCQTQPSSPVLSASAPFSRRAFTRSYMALGQRMMQ